MPRWGPEWSKQSRLEASKTLVVGCRNPKKARGLGRRHKHCGYGPRCCVAIITRVWSLGELDWGRRPEIWLGRRVTGSCLGLEITGEDQ